MSMRRMAALQAGLLLVAMFANAVSRKDTIRIKVLDAVTQSVSSDDNGVPNNCDQLTFDAYCRSSRAPQMTSTLLVQEGNEPPFRIRCTIDSRNSRCTPLPKGESFDARREKKGVTVYYVDDKGRPRKEFYTLVDMSGKAGAPTAATVVVTQPATAAARPPQNSPVTPPAPLAVATAQSAPATPPVSAQGDLKGKVRCNFNSTPPGAEITIDWRFVGNTPSEIGLSPGTHVVVISMEGFAEWKRELTVATDSVVNVTANLQRTQP
jgi:hypothetical protein